MRIYTTAPVRISLYGGGTDLPVFAEKFGGVIISMAINIRQRMTLFTEDDICSNPYSTVPPLGDPQFLYKIMDEFQLNSMGHCTVESKFDGILKSGLGSSAAACVALTGAFNKVLNLQLNRQQIAEKAWEIEVKKMGLYGGKQDQFSSTFGGINIMEIGNHVCLLPLNISREKAEDITKSIVLFYIGERKQNLLQEAFRELSKYQIDSLQRTKELTSGAISYLLNGNIDGIGKLMDKAWKLKKQSNPNVTNKQIDELYEAGKKAGAIGGKILGSGSGGYMIFIVYPTERTIFLEKMKKHRLETIDFSIDWNGLDIRIL